MKTRIIILLGLLINASALMAQGGQEHVISAKIGLDQVEISIGSSSNAKVDDVFQVFGKAQMIHPATGKLVNRDNVYLGKIKIVEVKELSSIAQITDENRAFSIGNTLIKVVSEEQEIVEKKRPVVAEFQPPKKQEYSETIYDRTPDKARPNKEVHIAELVAEGENLIATIDKGTETPAFGGAPKIGKKYNVFVPVVDTSSITGKQHVEGDEKAGELSIYYIEHDASKGILTLNQDTDHDFLVKNNELRTYEIKKQGYRSYIYLDVFSYQGESQFVPGIYTHQGYLVSSNIFIGAGIGIQKIVDLYFDSDIIYEDPDLLSIPIFLSAKYKILNKKVSPLISLQVGKSNVLKVYEHDYLFEDIKGKLFVGGSLGVETHLLNGNSIIFETGLSWFRFAYEFPPYVIDPYNDEVGTGQLNFSIAYAF